MPIVTNFYFTLISKICCLLLFNVIATILKIVLTSFFMLNYECLIINSFLHCRQIFAKSNVGLVLNTVFYRNTNV